MADLILHHYPMSPFAEKVRTVLGFKQLAWKSVLIPAVMPKPDLLALTGGYRKTPVLQIGADVYCDTALICDVLERLAPTPTLYPTGLQGSARIIAQWADGPLFWAAITHCMQQPGMAQLFAGAPPEALKVFAADRAAMSTGMTRLRPADATVAYRSYLRRLASMLDSGQAFLLGPTPCLADFAAYHPLWFTRSQTPAMADILQTTPVLLTWMDRMAAFGHGQVSRMTAIESIAVSADDKRATAPIDVYFQDDHGIPLGSVVSITAESFGAEPTVGELVAASRTRYTLRRSDPRAGQVQVHFPRAGYALKREATS